MSNEELDQPVAHTAVLTWRTYHGSLAASALRDIAETICGHSDSSSPGTEIKAITYDGRELVVTLASQ